MFFQFFLILSKIIKNTLYVLRLINMYQFQQILCASCPRYYVLVSFMLMVIVYMCLLPWHICFFKKERKWNFYKPSVVVKHWSTRALWCKLLPLLISDIHIQVCGHLITLSNLLQIILCFQRNSCFYLWV